MTFQKLIEAQQRYAADKARKTQNAINAARAQAQGGLAGRYGDDFKQRYAAALARGSTMDAQGMLANEMSGEFMDERDRPGYTPERVHAATTSTQVYDAVDPGAANTYEAERVEGPRDVQVGPLNPVERIESQNVAGPGSATIAGMERVDAANLDTGRADQVRASQDRYLQALEARAKGEGPSVAEASYNAKMADVANNAMAIAGQARGSDKAYARLKAMDTIGENTRRAAFDAAQLRAGEIDKATDALGAGLQGVRGTDLGQAEIAAKLRQEAALANQRTTTATEQFNAEALNRRGEFNTGVTERNAERAQAAAAANANAANARTMDEAQLRAGVDAGNVTRTQGAREFNASAGNDAAARNTAAINTRQSERAAAQTQARRDNTAAINQGGQFNATQIQDAAAKNQAAGLTGNAQEIDRRQGLAGSALSATGQAMGAEQTKNQSNASKKNLGDRLLDAGTSIAASYASKPSDERVKKDVKDVPTDAAERLARALDFKEFAYKGEYDDGNKHVGVMAQDLERDPVGKKFVSKNDDGVREVDYGSLASMLLAAALRSKKEARR